jgi:uncharacterized protein YciI
MFVVTLTYLKPLAEIERLHESHMAWLRRHYEAGLFVASGRRVPRTGGVILARSGDRVALEVAVAEDPFVVEGAASAEIVEFAPTLAAPGLEALKGL